MAPQLSVVLPAFNESARIGPTLDRLGEFAGGVPGGVEILVVDDGSTDDTGVFAAQAEARAIRWLRFAENRGKGAALRAGVLASSGNEILLCDTDLSTPLAEYERLRPYLATAGVVLGSRGVADSRITLRQPRYRELMGKTFNLLVRSLVVAGIRDTQCGFKLLRGELARRLFADMQIDRFAFDVELVWLARRRGESVVEVGVTWHDSPASSVHPLRDAARMFLDVLKIRWLHRGEPAAATRSPE
ncbi:MAG: dolichyl-phosphate beta-glucosyltransferase [Thermoanaerobaculia bacterium]